MSYTDELVKQNDSTVKNHIKYYATINDRNIWVIKFGGIKLMANSYDELEEKFMILVRLKRKALGIKENGGENV